MKILNKEIIADSQGIRIVKIDIHSPDIARKAQAGQFVVFMVKEEGERIPLTVVKTDPANGMVTIIVQEAGLSTKLLGRLEKGDSVYSMVGPLGHPTQIKKYGNVILIGGGVGIAEIYPVARAMKDAGNHVTAILGSRTKELLILEGELKEVSAEVLVMTDDGSYGRKGFVTDSLKELLGKSKYDLVYAVGPLPMMRAVSVVTKPYAIHTLVSLNTVMVDGTGMCGCCRVSVAGITKFSCVDGPEFEAGEVDWEELFKRNNIYVEKEKHICRLNNV
ncbi:MAG: sulfide/dihydroorotate dehydrogenase-like FAD/NAD-binding protein [Candidatus Omnitrophota bacterium]|nr:sulfide/dihydroorotate dehydrogenase-like FAD/NAD-binding protein [Candidatus Omnitrophota bacterium]